MKKALCLFIALVIMILPALYSCSGSNTPDKVNNTDKSITDITDGRIDESSDALSVESDYLFPDVNYGGTDFAVISTETKVWGPFSDIVIEEAIGEVLNDAVYNRNLQIEEKFDVKLKQMAVHLDNVISRARTLIKSGDDTYDAMFISHNWNGAIGTLAFEGGLYNLGEIPELQLDKPWWNQNIIEQCKIYKSQVQVNKKYIKCKP